jgi:Fe-S oxidoreductase
MRAEAWEKEVVPKPVEYACNSTANYGDPFSMGPGSRLNWTEGLDFDIQARIYKPAEVAYFLGCNVAMIPHLNSIARSVVEILEYTGIDYTILGDKEVCCGAPLIWGGNSERASTMAERNIWALRELGVKKIIFSCPSCIHHWPMTYKEESGVPVQKEFELYTLSQFIDGLVQKDLLKFKEQSNITVTYHDPCISARSLRIIDEPRNVIEKIPGVFNIDMLHSKGDTRCCGAHGLTNLADPLVSSQIAELRLRDVSVMPASRVISECPRCIHALEMATKTMNYNIKVQDIAELVAESLFEKERGG